MHKHVKLHATQEHKRNNQTPKPYLESTTVCWQCASRLFFVCTPVNLNNIRMKDKILSALKTKYSNLGFGEKAINGVADYLVGSITEESQIETSIAGVENLLKSFQGDADRIRTEKSDLQKKYDELEAKGVVTIKDETTKTDWQIAQEKQIADLMKANADLSLERTALGRQSFIDNQIKVLGIDVKGLEFLNVPSTLDEAGITAHLTKYKQHQVDNAIPSQELNPQVLSATALEEVASSLVDQYSGASKT